MENFSKFNEDKQKIKKLKINLGMNALPGKLLLNSTNIKEIFIQFFKFGIVGVSNTLISYGIYSLLVFLNLHYLIASIAAFSISVLNSFFWNNKYVFKKEENQKRNILKSLLKTYISYAGTGLILQNILLFIFIDILEISKYIAPLFGLIITIPLNFLLNKLWAFRTVNTNKEIAHEKD